MDRDPWPELPFATWSATCETLRLWTQIVGKIRLAKAPWLNHSWHVVLYPTVRGLTTSPIHDGARALQVDFDFVDHDLVLRDAEGEERRVALQPRTVADFRAATLAALEGLGFEVSIHDVPNEIEGAIPFSNDETHRSYDAEFARRFWRVLLSTHRVFERFRTAFLGKCSPTHFFWGSFDLALTRFSGRRAPLHPGGFPNLPDSVTREAYSHEVSSAGFWPGGGVLDEAAFYSYAYPEPEGFGARRAEPSQAYFHPEAREFFLPYDAVRTAQDPDATLLAFLQSTYEAAAESGAWDRNALDCELGRPGVPRAIRT